MVIQAKLTRNRNETFAAETAAHPLLVLPKRSDKASVDMQQQQLQLWTDSGNCSSGQFAVIANCVNTKANKTLSSSPNDHQCQLRRLGTKELSNKLAKIGTKVLPGAVSRSVPLCTEYSRSYIMCAGRLGTCAQDNCIKGKAAFGLLWRGAGAKFSLSLCVDIGVAPAKAQKKSQKTVYQFDADAGAQVGHSNCFRWPSQARPGQARSGCGCGSIELSAAANYVSL